MNSCLSSRKHYIGMPIEKRFFDLVTLPFDLDNIPLDLHAKSQVGPSVYLSVRPEEQDTDGQTDTRGQNYYTCH